MEANELVRVKKYLNNNPDAEALVAEATQLLGYAEEGEFINDVYECVLPRITGKSLTPRIDIWTYGGWLHMGNDINDFLYDHPHSNQADIAHLEQPGIAILIILAILIPLSPFIIPLIPLGLLYFFGMPRLRCIVYRYRHGESIWDAIERYK